MREREEGRGWGEINKIYYLCMKLKKLWKKRKYFK